MNSVQLLGRLTRDPDVRYTDGGSTIARFSLAVDRRFKQEGGETADFINCISFGKTAEFIEKYFTKGIKIALNGRIQTGSYTNKDGVKVYTTDVVVENVEFAESKGSNAENAAPAPAPNGDFMSIPDGIDEELPFN
jgi:single-strand DNA-binding protein